MVTAMIGKHENYKDPGFIMTFKKEKEKKKIPLWSILEVARA